MSVKLWSPARLRKKLDTLWKIYKAVESNKSTTFESLVQNVDRSRGTIAESLKILREVGLVDKTRCPTCGRERVYQAKGKIKELAFQKEKAEGFALEEDLSDEEYFEHYVLWFLKRRLKIKKVGRKGISKSACQEGDKKDIVEFYKKKEGS